MRQEKADTKIEDIAAVNAGVCRHCCYTWRARVFSGGWNRQL